MYIRQIDLINIRSFLREKIEFKEGINILVGKNNSGKSTILRSLYKLQNESYIDKNDVRKYQDTLYDSGRLIIKLVDINDIEKKYFKDSSESRAAASLKSNQATCIFTINPMPNIRNESLWYDTNYQIRSKKYDVIELLNELGEVIPFPERISFPAKEDENNFIYPFLSQRKTKYYGEISTQATMSVGDDFSHLAAKIQRVSNPTHPKHKDYLKLCETILGFVPANIPNQHHQSDIGIYATQNKVISLNQMGEGVANILGLIVMLLTEDRKLYLIEELENDVHPTAIRQLLDLIIEKSKSNQFVISTHSHIVLQHLGSLPKSKLFYVDWKMNENNIQQSSVRTITNNNIDERIDILNKLGYSLEDYGLYSGYLLLEESSAEKIIRDFLIPWFVPELRFKLKTIAAQGVDDLRVRAVDFKRLYVYLYGNQIYKDKTWIIADGDVAGKNCIESLKMVFTKSEHSNLLNWENENFENYYPTRFNSQVENLINLDKSKKRIAKKQLLEDLINWVNKNEDEAKEEFKNSAKEILLKLNQINKKLVS